jgi:coenzyme F420-0:L-glutamate ligase/coenzyme F420-1:gamma-L-glutamate ligase
VRVEILPISDLPELGEGAVIGELIAARTELHSGDVVVVSQKVVSKAEGRVRGLSEVEPGARARELAEQLGKDPALVELVLAESRAIVRAERGVLIAETHSGWICANAGIDASNLPGEDAVALLPRDPDGSARRIRSEIEAATGARPAVVIADSFGRPWRVGQCDVAIGAAGLRVLDDWRGRTDRQGRELTATTIAIADQVAAAADLARDKGSGDPAALVRGLARHVTDEDGPGAAILQRPTADDLFR